ncbi:MAG: hypothetical protein HKN23_19350 [Verrucomicrobiales bacterium]|nr:hypothetical protein [Verrucomicrobiales bacterium]
MKFGLQNGNHVLYLFHNSQTPDSAERLHRASASAAADIEVIPVAIRFENFSGKLPSCRFRYMVCDHIKVEDFRFVTYLDSDIVVRRDLSRLLDHFDQKGKDFLVTACFGRNMWNDPAFGGHLPPEAEHFTRFHLGIQSGHFSIRGSLVRRLYERWSILDGQPVRPGFLSTDQTSQNALVWECLSGSIPAEVSLFPFSFAVAPSREQMKRLGVDRVLNATLWHFWPHDDQADRVKLADRELRRLADPPDTSSLQGNWLHLKPGEDIENIWSFTDDGLVYADSGHLGTLIKSNQGFKINWTWEASEELPSRIEDSMIAASSQNGDFSLSRIQQDDYTQPDFLYTHTENGRNGDREILH